MHLGTKVGCNKAPVTWKSTKSHRLLPPSYRLWNKTAWPVERCEQEVTLFRPAVLRAATDQAPTSLRSALAIDSENRSTSARRSASTITRAKGSVPEYRNTTRPFAPRVVLASSSARDTSGSESKGGLD